MDFTPGQLKLLAYWGEIQSGVAQRVSTADLWGIVRDAAIADQTPLRGVSATDMNLLRSIAAEQQRVMRTLDSAGPDQAIDPSMIARDVSSRDQADQNLAPAYVVRFEHFVLVDGEEQTLWRSSVIEGQLPITKGILQDTIEFDAMALAEDYGVTHVGVGSIQISAV